MQGVCIPSALPIREPLSALSAHPRRPRPFSHPLLNPSPLLVMPLRLRQTAVHRRASPQGRVIPALSPLRRQLLLSLVARHARWLIPRLPPTVTTQVHPAVRLHSRFLHNVMLLCPPLCLAAQLFILRMTSPPLLLSHHLSVLIVTSPQQLNLCPQ